jgi:hypothetical protein
MALAVLFSFQTVLPYAGKKWALGAETGSGQKRGQAGMALN